MSENIDLQWGEINQVSMGPDYKDAMKWKVGFPNGPQAKYTISNIVINEYDSFYFGVRSYNIYAKNKNGEEYLLATTGGVPCMVHFKDPNEHPAK